MEPKELTILINKKSKAGRKEVEEMLKHPLSAKKLENFIKRTQESMAKLQRLRNMNLL